MNNLKKKVNLLFLVSILFLGAFTFQTSESAKAYEDEMGMMEGHKSSRRGKFRAGRRKLKKQMKQLNLTKEQKAQIREIKEKHRKEVQTEIKTILDDQQKAKFEEMISEMEQKRKNLE